MVWAAIGSTVSVAGSALGALAGTGAGGGGRPPHRGHRSSAHGRRVPLTAARGRYFRAPPVRTAARRSSHSCSPAPARPSGGLVAPVSDTGNVGIVVGGQSAI